MRVLCAPLGPALALKGTLRACEDYPQVRILATRRGAIGLDSFTADSRHSYFSEKVRGTHHTRRIVLQLGLKLRIAKGTSEVVRRFPNRVIDEHTASSDASMQLRRNETGLSLHYRRVRAPGTKELFDLFRINAEFVDQDDGSPRVVHLLEDRDVRVHFNQLWHVGPLFYGALSGCVNHNVCRTVRITNSIFAMASQSHSKERMALIVGAGIGGLAAGIALRRTGWHVKIFERCYCARAWICAAAGAQCDFRAQASWPRGHCDRGRRTSHRRRDAPSGRHALAYVRRYECRPAVTGAASGSVTANIARSAAGSRRQ